MNNDLSSFDFENYRIKNIKEYKKVFPIYESFTLTLYELIKKFLGNRNLKYYTIEHRAKDYKSFGAKSSIPSDEDPNSPKYDDPLKQITDISGIRVITYFLDTISLIQ
jgi:ppGpp synthetase/RelA/SpoT-type nucleotidyltranferase